jgi:hypothetical protein
MNDLTQALKEALAATVECNPAELDAGDLELWHLCDRRIEQIIEVLIGQHDEVGPVAREVLARIQAEAKGG